MPSTLIFHSNAMHISEYAFKHTLIIVNKKIVNFLQPCYNLVSKLWGWCISAFK